MVRPASVAVGGCRRAYSPSLTPSGRWALRLALQRTSSVRGQAVVGHAKFLVLPVDAGEYMWSKINIYPKQAFLRNSNRCVVKANVISYLGHIQLHSAGSRVQIRAEDRTDDMRAHLTQKFPKFSQDMAFEKDLAQLRL